MRRLTQRLLTAMALEQNRPLAMSEGFLRDVMARDWRGNVRELRSYLEQAVVMSETGVLDEPLADSPKVGSTPASDRGEIAPLHLMVEEVERTHIRRALTRCESSVSKTAELLGISRKTLWEKMKRLQMTV